MSHSVIKKNIERLLKEKDWRVADLENKVGHSRSVTNIFRGLSKNPTIEILQSIARAFNVEIQELLLDNTQDSIVNLPLLHDTCNKVLKELETMESPNDIKYNNIFSLLKEIYEYSIQLGLDQADENYIKWATRKLIKTRFPD